MKAHKGAKVPSCGLSGSPRANSLKSNCGGETALNQPVATLGCICRPGVGHGGFWRKA